jgi:hypothetical protein
MVCKLFNGQPKDMSTGLLSPFTHSLLMSLVWTLCILVSHCFPVTRVVSRAMWEMEKIGLYGAFKKNLSLLAFSSQWHNRVKFQAVMELPPLPQCFDQTHGGSDLLCTYNSWTMRLSTDLHRKWNDIFYLMFHKSTNKNKVGYRTCQE